MIIITRNPNHVVPPFVEHNINTKCILCRLTRRDPSDITLYLSIALKTDGKISFHSLYNILSYHEAMTKFDDMRFRHLTCWSNTTARSLIESVSNLFNHYTDTFNVEILICDEQETNDTIRSYARCWNSTACRSS
jgi:hypothetical protein